MSTHPHAPVAEFGRQSMFVGQTPPHCGEVLMSQVVGSCLQLHDPTASGVQVEPTGQAPPHCGARVCSQGIGSSTQPHLPVAVFVRQTMLTGQTPPHRGAGLWSQVTVMSWQPQAILALRADAAARRGRGLRA
jgi:hypothetical protein